MTNTFMMIQYEDLKRAFTEVLEEFCEKHRMNDKPSEEEGQWLTRDEVCDLLRITPTTLWRKENEGVIKKHKMGRRNLYSKKEVLGLFASVMEADRNVK